MDADSSFARQHVNSKKRECFVLTYKVTDCQSQETMESIKEEFDAIIAQKGGQTTLDESLNSNESE